MLIGAAIGVASFMVPLYISEIAPASLRGGMVSLNQLAVTIGILVSYGVNYVFSFTENWHAMFAVGALPGLVLLIGMYLLPESPRWLVSVHRKEDAAGVLKKTRARQDVAGEVTEIEEEIKAETGGRLSDLLAPALRLPIIIGSGPGDPAAGDRGQHGRLLRSRDLQGSGPGVRNRFDSRDCGARHR